MTTDNLFDSLTPEQLAALLQGSTLQDEGGLLAQQLEQLLGQGMQHREYSTPLGAGLGGLAEALDGTANAFHAKALRGDQRKNLDAQSKLKGDFGALLRSPKDPASEFGLPQFSPSAPPMMQADMGMQMPELDISRFASQPADPTQIVDDGSAGWGIDLSAPGHAAAVSGGQQMPELDISQFASRPSPIASAGQMPDMTQLPARRERRRPFAL